MIDKLKAIKKSTLILIGLLILNITTFALVSSNIKQHYAQVEVVNSSSIDDNHYFKAGVNVLDWSHKLLRYFRK